MNKTIYVTDVSAIKSGRGPKGKWTLYRVTDQEGVKYSTFEDRFQVGMEYEVEVEQEVVEKNGNRYTNWKILPARHFKAASPAAEAVKENDDGRKIIALLQSIDTRLTEIRNLLAIKTDAAEDDILAM